MLASIPILTGSKLRHEKTPPALCQTHSVGGVPVSSDLFFSRQGTVHKVALFILRSCENSVHSVEKLTGQHTNVIKLKFLPNTKKHPPRLI